MKRILTPLIVALSAVIVWAQSPEKISYQAVVRNESNHLVTNQTVGMEISILQGSGSGTAVYKETQNPSTNANGLVTLEIGKGTTSTDFSAIDWTNGPYFIKTKTDPNGGENYTITGTSQLISVPYALHSKTAESVTSGIDEYDPVFYSSPASSITDADIFNWNQKSDAPPKYMALAETEKVIGNPSGGVILFETYIDTKGYKELRVFVHVMNMSYKTNPFSSNDYMTIRVYHGIGRGSWGYYSGEFAMKYTSEFNGFIQILVIGDKTRMVVFGYNMPGVELEVDVAGYLVN